MFEDENLNEDRGDTFTPTVTPPVADVKEPEVKTPDTKEADVTEQARGADGKFAKKDEPADEPRIPKARFDEAVSKERERAEAAERRLADLEARMNKQEPTQVQQVVDPRATMVETLDAKIVELHTKRDSFLADGDAAKASELLKEIRAEERKLNRLETEMISEERAGRATNQVSEEARIDEVVKALEGDYDILRKGSETYNDRMIDLVVAEQQRLMQAEGLSPSKALLKAGSDIMTLVGQKKTSEVTKNVEDEKSDLKAERQKAALAKSVDTAKRQPGALKDVGADSNAAGAKSPDLEVDKLTDKEFGELTNEQLAKMRGDFV